MATRATGTFTVDSWDGDSYDEGEGATLARARLTKTFQGEVEGTSIADLLTAQASEGSAGYVAIERFSGALHGRSGSFVLQHSGTAERGATSARVSVVPDSATGDLRGLRGEAEIIVAPDGGHTIVLDYELP
ncbi:MAG: hypothetical protein QOF51_720 [Chloroflexota bacterium]|jgi:hypothetical protein|nr:hypothetical protein [Chloroflexota bacterium]